MVSVLGVHIRDSEWRYVFGSYQDIDGVRAIRLYNITTGVSLMREDKRSRTSWGCSSVVKCLPSICKALGSIPSTSGGREGERGVRTEFYGMFNI